MMILRTGRNRQAQEKGFTLIEIMLSVAILSIGLVLVLQGFAHSLNVLRISEDNLKATFVTENKFAEGQIHAREDWDDFRDGIDERFKFEDIKCVWEVEVERVEWESEDIPEGYEEEFEKLNEVKATLSWKEGKREGVIPLITYMRSHAEEE